MKTTTVRVPWGEGLHMRPAAQIALAARRFHSQIKLRFGGRVAEAGSILGLVILCATLNSTIDIEANGDDEQEAVKAVAACFDSSPPPVGLS